MTPTSEPAFFIRDSETGHYIPANRVATTLAAQFSKMRLDEKDLLAVKAKGIRVTKPNGEPICLGVKA